MLFIHKSTTKSLPHINFSSPSIRRLIRISCFQSESGATESGSISSYANDSEIEMEIKQDPQTVTVPITVCVAIMIG